MCRGKYNVAGFSGTGLTQLSDVGRRSMTSPIVVCTSHSSTSADPVIFPSQHLISFSTQTTQVGNFTVALQMSLNELNIHV